MKRLLTIGLVLLLLIPKISYAASNPYPKTQKFNGVISTPCTRVAWQEVYDRLGIALPGWGNAINWYKNAADAGYQVGREAKPNSIAVYSGFYEYGHVAFVIDVFDETMKVVENKGSSEGKTEGTRSKAIGSGEESGLYLIGFIYVTEPKTSSGSSTTTSPTTPTKSGNSNLKSLNITNINFAFQKDTYTYFLEAPYEVENVKITGEVENSKSTVEGLKEYALEVGENSISIQVTAEDKSTSTYVINITRNDKEINESNTPEQLDPQENENDKQIEKNMNKEVKINYYYLIPIVGIICVLVVVLILKKKNKNK